MSRSILIVDDEKNIRRTLAMILTSEGFEAFEAATGREAIDVVSSKDPDLVILDVKLSDGDGIEILRELRRQEPDRMVIMISGHATIATAVEATRQGAFDFLEKPLTKERILVAVRNALRLESIGREMRELKAREADRYEMLGESEPLRRIRREIAQAAPTTARVLILGESGTGKELVARAVHDSSARCDKPFIKVNCAAIPEDLIESELFGNEKGAFTGAVAARDGKFMQADGGTLFLDEVADMSPRAQAKCLRALQEGEIERVGGSQTFRVDVRVVSATNKNLKALVTEGRFREDLYFRLNVVPIQVPPLRERLEDIPLLASLFLERLRQENNRPQVRFSAEALEILRGLPWPGNVRELHNVVERLVIMCRGAEIGPTDLAAAGVVSTAGKRAASGIESPGETSLLRTGTGPYPSPVTTGEISRLGGLIEARRRFEESCIRTCLRETRGNVSEAARVLNIDRTNLHKKIQSFGIDPDHP